MVGLPVDKKTIPLATYSPRTLMEVNPIVGRVPAFKLE